MKKIGLGQTITIVANIGVIAGIFFLAMEVRDNAAQARAAGIQDRSSDRSRWWEQIAADESLAEVYRLGLDQYDQLSVTDQIRFDSLMRSYISFIGVALVAREEVLGISDLSEDRVNEGELLRHLDQPGFRQ